jgi:two-component system chemotaxis sensor kinase CheA
LEGILRLSELQFREDAESAEDRQAELAELALETQNLLLFQSSGSEMFALDLSMVSRVEEIEASNIERVGSREYIKFRGDSLRVIRPESYLSVTQGDAQPQKLYVIIPKLVHHPIGIVIHRIYDNITTRVALNSEDVRLKGIIGSTIYSDRLVLILNLYELFELAAPEFYAVANQQTKRTGHVLLAEDTPFFQKMEKSYLEDAGYKVTLVTNGAEALEALERQSFDLVVSDIQMPVMDGYQLVKRIRENKSWSHMPVIAVTSMTGEWHAQQGMDSGFDFYEAKLDRDRLLSKIDEAIRLRKQVVAVD